MTFQRPAKDTTWNTISPRISTWVVLRTVRDLECPVGGGTSRRGSRGGGRRWRRIGGLRRGRVLLALDQQGLVPTPPSAGARNGETSSASAPSSRRGRGAPGAIRRHNGRRDSFLQKLELMDCRNVHCTPQAHTKRPVSTLGNDVSPPLFRMKAELERVDPVVTPFLCGRLQFWQ